MDLKKPLAEIMTKIPDHFLSVLKVFGNKTRIGIILELMHEDRQPYSRLLKSSQGTGGNVHNHIKKIELAGIIQNYIQKIPNIKEFSFFKLTDLGRMFAITIIKWYENNFQSENVDRSPLNIPDEVISHCKSLNSKVRLALTILLKDGDLTFTQIKESGSVKKSQIAVELKKLERAGIVRNYYQKKEDSTEFSFYALTMIGDAFLTQMVGNYRKFFMGSEERSNNINEHILPTMFTGNLH